jgi:predicted house-cleaning noncanonical NTP pyrophosphatase (MazG superfamily)
MKSTREIFKGREYLLDEPEVASLLEYCEQLQDEIVEFKFQKTNNKELAMLDMLKEVIKGCYAFEKEQMEHERFGFEAPNYQETISNLKRYILDRCRDEKIYL